MASGDVTITVFYTDNTSETFLCPAAYAGDIVKGDHVIKFKGRKTSGTGETSDTDQEITRASTKRVKYATEA